MKKLIILSFILLSSNAMALMEFDFEFGYKKTKFGSERQNKSVTRRYSGSMAFYFLSMTALEFNYSTSEDETIVNHDTSAATTLAIKSENSTLVTQTHGVGIRQALASRKSFLVPTLSIGWARQKFKDRATATIENKTNGDLTIYDTGESVITYDSVFAAFALKLRLTKTLSLKGSINTAFKAFEWNQARDQLSYTAGFSWIF